MSGRRWFYSLGQRARAWRLPERAAFRLMTGCDPSGVPFWAFDAFADGFLGWSLP